MIGKLQKKLTALVLAALLLVALGIVLAINWINWHNLTRQARGTLEVLAGNQGQRPMLFNPMAGEGFPAEMPEAPQDFRQDMGRDRELRGRGRMQQEGLNAAVNLSTFYTVRLNGEGEVAEWFSDRSDLYSDEEVEALAARVLSGGKTFGRVETQFYFLSGEGEERMLVVLDQRLEMAAAQRVLAVTSLVALAAYVLLSAGAVALIRRMIAPVREAFDRQKQFVWDASHELKTPLAVISANAEALAGEVGPSESLEYIQSEVRRTDRLVQNLLTLARMDQGTARAEMKPFDLGRAVLSVALPFESVAFEAGKRMDVQVEEGVQYTGDEEMIKQLVVILLSNAVKYSGEGGAITLSLDKKGERRVLRVHNTGEPIAPEDIKKIFDRFYRVDSSHNRTVEGNGLGLAIAQNIAAMHRGKINVDSAPGKGTAFVVTL